MAWAERDYLTLSETREHLSKAAGRTLTDEDIIFLLRQKDDDGYSCIKMHFYFSGYLFPLFLGSKRCGMESQSFSGYLPIHADNAAALIRGNQIEVKIAGFRPGSVRSELEAAIPESLRDRAKGLFLICRLEGDSFIERSEVVNPQDAFFPRAEIERFLNENEAGSGQYIHQSPSPAEAINILHYTRLLALVGEVQRRYWGPNWNSNDRDTTPRQNDICKWLRDERGLTDNEAKAVERVACPVDRNPAKPDQSGN